MYGAEVANTFGEAPSLEQDFFICPDKAFHGWWIYCKTRQTIPKLVLAAMQEHPESPRIWEKYANKIIRGLGLKPAVHKPCLYLGIVEGECVLFKLQVDDFEIATSSE